MRKIGRAQPPPQYFYAIAIALFAYSWLSVNIYLPILPELEGLFQTTPQMARLTVTIFLIGICTTQLVWGPLSDRFGRRPVLLTGIGLSAIGALLTGFTTDIYLFIGARFLESLGLGVASVLARSLLTDSLDRAHVAVAMSYGTIAVAIAPAVAPILGGYLDDLATWRSIFFFLSLYGATLLAWCVLRLPETNKHKNPSLRPAKVATTYMEMLRHRQYLGYLLAYAISYGTMLGYYAAAPYIFINVLGYRSHEYGFLLIFNVGFYVVGALVARMVVPRFGSNRVLLAAIAVFAAAAIVAVILDQTMTMSTVGVLIPMSIFIFGAALVSPAANTGAMTMFKDRAGASTAIVGFAPVIGGALFNAGLSTIHITRLWELGAYVGLSALLSVAGYLFLLHRKTADGAG